MINPSYGPSVDNPEVSKYCSKCKASKEVDSSANYCPSCGTGFGSSSGQDTTKEMVKAADKSGGTVSYSEESGKTKHKDGSTTEYNRQT